MLREAVVTESTYLSNKPSPASGSERLTPANFDEIRHQLCAEEVREPTESISPAVSQLALDERLKQILEASLVRDLNKLNDLLSGLSSREVVEIASRFSAHSSSSLCDMIKKNFPKEEGGAPEGIPSASILMHRLELAADRPLLILPKVDCDNHLMRAPYGLVTDAVNSYGRYLFVCEDRGWHSKLASEGRSELESLTSAAILSLRELQEHASFPFRKDQVQKVIASLEAMQKSTSQIDIPPSQVAAICEPISSWRSSIHDEVLADASKAWASRDANLTKDQKNAARERMVSVSHQVSLNRGDELSFDLDLEKGLLQLKREASLRADHSALDRAKQKAAEDPEFQKRCKEIFADIPRLYSLQLRIAELERGGNINKSVNDFLFAEVKLPFVRREANNLSRKIQESSAQLFQLEKGVEYTLETIDDAIGVGVIVRGPNRFRTATISPETGMLVDYAATESTSLRNAHSRIWSGKRSELFREN